MKKQTKKRIKYFLIAFVLTLLLGTVAMFGYSYIIEKPWTKQDVLESSYLAEETEVSEAEKVPKIPQETALEEKLPENVMAESEPQEPVQPQEPGEVVLTFGGDICFHDPFANMGALVARGGSIESCISADLLEEMRNADICMVNNEFPYSNRGTPIPEKAFTFRSKPENVKLLHEMGVDVVSLANNHAYDHGEIALLDTFDTLENADVAFIGAGRNLSEASEPAIFEINGVRIAIVAATQIERLDTPDTKGATENAPGVLRCFSQKELNHFLSVVENTKKECDVLVVYIHWGTENTDVLDWAQPYQADLISRAGADIIVGAHPHCLQGLDSVNGIPVIYSLGNYWFNSKPLDTALLKVTVDGQRIKSVQMIPARQQDCSTFMLHDSEKQRVLDYLRTISPNISLDEEGYIDF